MSHAQTYQTKWPDQLSQVKEKAQHSNVSQKTQNHALSKSIQHDQGTLLFRNSLVGSHFYLVSNIRTRV